MIKLIAADIPLAPSGGFQGIGPLGLQGKSASEAPSLFNTALSTVIGVMTIVAFIWFTFQFIIGAIRIITSGGDKAALEGARKQITTGLIGLVVVVAAIFILDLIGSLIGVQLLGGGQFIPQLLNQSK